MTELNELASQAWRELNQGPSIGWDQATTNALHTIYPEAETPQEFTEREALIAKTSEFVGKVASRPLEPVLFYRDQDEYMADFAALIPDPERPIEFMLPRYEEERRAVIRVNGAHKERTLPYGGLNANQKILVDSSEDSNVKVWMGGSAQWLDTSPDLYEQNREHGYRYAVGAEETGDLLDELGQRQDINQDRLFGALFHIAWLCDDFDAAMPRTSTFSSQIDKARAALAAEDQAIGSALLHSSRTHDRLQEAAAQMRKRSIAVESYLNRAKNAQGNVYIPTFTPNPGLRFSVNEAAASSDSPPLSDALNTLSRQDYQNRQARQGIQRQLKIIELLANAQPA